MTELLQTPFIAGAMAGLTAAAVVDFGAFRSFKSLDDALAYDWKLAAWRWFQGAVSSGLGNTLFQAVV